MWVRNSDLNASTLGQDLVAVHFAAQIMDLGIALDQRSDRRAVASAVDQVAIPVASVQGARPPNTNPEIDDNPF